MTGLARLKATGSGTLAFRVEFAGLDTVFCTHPAMKGPEFDGSPNLLPAAGSVTWTQTGGTPTITTGQADPDGGTNATRIVDANTSDHSSAACSVGAYVSGTAVRCELKIKREVGTAFAQIQLAYDSTYDVHSLLFDPQTSHWQVLSGGIRDVRVEEFTPGWWRVTFEHDGDVGSDVRLRVHPSVGTSMPTFAVGTTGGLTVYAPSIVSSYGRERVGGLSLQGFKTTERAHLAHSTVDAKGATIMIADVGERATLALAAEPEHTTWLTASVSDTATAIPVASTEGWPDAGVLHIDTEAIAYASKGTTTIGGVTHEAFLGCTRGIWRTVAQHHYVGTGGALRYPEVTSRVTVLEGRRVRLHVYERGDDKRGPGTQRWLGVVTGSPRMVGPAWSIMCDSIARVLDAELGVGLDEPIGPRGIYYNAANQWRLRIARRVADKDISYWSGGPFPESDWLSGAEQPPKWITFPEDNTAAGDGFFESQAEFIAAVQAKIDAATAGWNTSIFIEPFGASYRFRVRSEAATPDGVMLRLYSRVDGWLEPGLHGNDEGPAPEPVPPSARYSITLEPHVDYYVYLREQYDDGAIPGAGGVPRGVHGAVSPGDAWGPLAAGSPAYRLHLGGTVAAPPVGSAALIEWPDTGTEHTYEVRAVNGGERHVGLNRPAGLVDRGWHRYTPELMPTIRFGRTYGATDAISSLGTYTLMRALTDEAPEQVNLGAQPMIEPGDWNAVEWEAAYLGASPLAAQRRYSAFEPIKLLDFIAPDLQLASHFLAFDEAGRLTIKRLRLASQTEAATYALDRSTMAAWPTYERSPMGQINTLALVAGYDARAGEVVGQPFSVRDVGSYGRQPNAKILKIEPKSAYIGPAITPDDVMEVAQTVLGIFSGPYAYVTCETTLQALDVTIGSTVSITTKHLPSEAGVRGMDGQVGLVIAREIDWYGAKIELTVLVDARRIAGYAPSALITAQTNVSGDTWDLELDTRTLASGEEFADHFEPGDAIEIDEFDASAPVNRAGTVESVSGTTMRVTLNTGWSPGAARWLVRSAVSFDLSASSRQAHYAFVASSDMRVWFSDGSQPARQFAP